MEKQAKREKTCRKKAKRLAKEGPKKEKLNLHP